MQYFWRLNNIVSMSLFTHSNDIVSFNCKVENYESLYTVNYSDYKSGRSCAIATIPSSSCVGGACSTMFNVLTSSLCPNTTDISISVSISDSFAYGYFPTSKLIEIGWFKNNIIHVLIILPVPH